jgi:IS5 family transposase
VNRILTQQRKDKNKLYALHAPEVECISKVRHEVASVIVSTRCGDETGRSVDRSLPVHASLVTVLCEAIGTMRSGHSAILVP